MNSSIPNLSDININTPKLETFKGIKDGEISSVFDSKAKLTKSTTFGRKVNQRAAKAFNKAGYEKRNDKFKQQKALSNRRADILTGKNQDSGEVEEKLLQLINEASIEQEKGGVKYIEIEQLDKQIQSDIRIHLSNRIKKATTAEELELLYNKITRLDPESPAKEHPTKKIDKHLINALKKDLDTQCDRVAKALKSHITETSLKEESATDAVTMKCNFLIKWFDTIKEISPNAFKNNQKQLAQLMSNTLESGLSAVTPHPNDLGTTIQNLSKIEHCANAVNQRVKDVLKENSSRYKKSHNAAEQCKNTLRENLAYIPQLVEKYKVELKKISDCENMNKQYENDQQKTNNEIAKTKAERANIKQQKAKGLFGKHKIFRLLDRNYQNQVKRNKRELKASNQEINIASAKIKITTDNLAKAQQERDILHNEVQNAITTYGTSIAQLVEFESLNSIDKTAITVDNLVATISNDAAIARLQATQNINESIPQPQIHSDASEAETHPAEHRIENAKETLKYITETLDSSDNPSITKEDKVWIIDRIKYTLKDESINRASLKNFFDYFNSLLNKSLNQNGQITYYDQGLLNIGFDNGLQYIESKKSISDAKRVLSDVLNNHQQHPVADSRSADKENPIHFSQAPDAINSPENISASLKELSKTIHADKQPNRTNGDQLLIENAIIEAVTELVNEDDEGFVDGPLTDTDNGDEDSDFTAPQVTVPDAKKEEAIKKIISLMEQYNVFNSKNEDKNKEAAVKICNMDEFDHWDIANVIDDLKNTNQ